MNGTSLLLATVQRARQTYPSLPYHNVQHMDDVVRMTKELITLIPQHVFSVEQPGMMQVTTMLQLKNIGAKRHTQLHYLIKTTREKDLG